MFDAIGICDTCGRPAFSLTEINNPCNDDVAGTPCRGRILDSKAPTVVRPSGPSAGTTPPIPHQAGAADKNDFRILGYDVQYVDCQLGPGETLVAEAGALLFLAEGISFETICGDAASSGLLGSLMNPIKRAVSGESALLTVFTNRTDRPKRLAFAAPHTGSIIPIELSRYGGEIHCQRGAFLCATAGVTLSPGLHRNMAATFVANEGIIIQKIRGEGVAFVHVGGSVIEYDLAPEEELFVETGAMAAWQGNMVLDVKFHTSIRNLLFANEGIALTHLRGPGRAWIQTLPFNKLARRIVQAAPQEKRPS